MVIENNPKELAAMKKFHEGNRADGLKPVSYTHLDVYKRQGVNRASEPCNI